MEASLLVDSFGSLPRLQLNRSLAQASPPSKLAISQERVALFWGEGEEVRIEGLTHQDLQRLTIQNRVILIEPWDGKSRSHLVELAIFPESQPAAAAPTRPTESAQPASSPDSSLAPSMAGDKQAHSFSILVFVAPLAFALFTALFRLMQELVIPVMIGLLPDWVGAGEAPILSATPWLTPERPQAGLTVALLLLCGYVACGGAGYLGSLFSRVAGARRSYATSRTLVLAMIAPLGGLLALALVTDFRLYPLATVYPQPVVVAIALLGAAIAYFGAREGLDA